MNFLLSGSVTLLPDNISSWYIHLLLKSLAIRKAKIIALIPNPLGYERTLYIEKSNDIIHYINIILKENHLIISTDKDDAFEKNPTSSPNKILKQTRNKRELHHPMKGIYKKIYS